MLEIRLGWNFDLYQSSNRSCSIIELERCGEWSKREYRGNDAAGITYKESISQKKGRR